MTDQLTDLASNERVEVPACTNWLNGCRIHAMQQGCRTDGPCEYMLSRHAMHAGQRIVAHPSSELQTTAAQGCAAAARRLADRTPDCNHFSQQSCTGSCAPGAYQTTSLRELQLQVRTDADDACAEEWRAATVPSLTGYCCKRIIIAGWQRCRAG